VIFNNTKWLVLIRPLLAGYEAPGDTLSIGVALFRCLSIPLGCCRVIRCHTVTILITKTKAVLSRSVTVFSRLPIPPHCFWVVF
jgi:hypothetical protein